MEDISMWKTFSQLGAQKQKACVSELFSTVGYQFPIAKGLEYTSASFA